MIPASPPTVALSRSRLKALAKWVRDELDMLVAREGPDVLRPDDVLVLHETFIALRLSTEITALDLRATGIHRAVLDIAGVATRWPGRLCDDCDKIISTWTAKFGPLDALRPFLYGRGGRLEGIASVTEYSRETLLKRWNEHCPEKIHPKRSHRNGNLGFRAGDWWISTLFAHHAGIIGLEAVEGGTTFDKHGAYAVVLKNTGEVEAGHGNNFTYRVPQWDRGKFRLTAATPRSRDPIRVLRSHSINSMWGPKAGVRYEGLFGVKGWSIRQAKSADTAGGQWKEGDIVYEVNFERCDSVPMTEVSLRPTATEVDDYTEYKRLRKQHRDGKRKTTGSITDLSHIVPQHSTRAAPPIAPPIAPLIAPSIPVPMAPLIASSMASPIVPPAPTTSPIVSPVTATVLPTILRIRSGSITPKVHFRHPHFDLPEEDTQDGHGIVSPIIEGIGRFPLPTPQGTLTVPVSIARRSQTQDTTDQVSHASSRTSNTSNISPLANIKEVAPWIDYEAKLELPTPSPATPVELSSSPTAATSTSASSKDRNTNLNAIPQAPRHALSNATTLPIGERRKSGNFKNITGFLASGTKAKEERKSVVVRSRNPMAKLFDGTTSLADEDSQPDELYRNDSVVEETERVHSPVPFRPFSPDNLAGRRGALYMSDNEALVPVSPTDDAFKPVWLEGLISTPKKVAARQTVVEDVDVEKDGVDAEMRLRLSMETWDGTWRNPWVERGGRVKQTSISEVAPDVMG